MYSSEHKTKQLRGTLHKAPTFGGAYSRFHDIYRKHPLHLKFPQIYCARSQEHPICRPEHSICYQTHSIYHQKHQITFQPHPIYRPEHSISFQTHPIPFETHSISFQTHPIYRPEHSISFQRHPVCRPQHSVLPRKHRESGLSFQQEVHYHLVTRFRERKGQ